jgi:hypothetical protein
MEFSMQNDEPEKHFDYLKLVICIIMASGGALYVFYRISILYHYNLLIGISAGLATLAALVWVLYLLDKSSQYF